MKAMTLRLNELEYERLRALSYVEERAMTEVIREAIQEYIQRKVAQDKFQAVLKAVMREHAGLITELAGQ